MAYETRFATTRMRSGPNGPPRGHVTQIQRSRMLTAALEAVEEQGYAGMTVAQVIGRARVSRKTFYEIFSDREDCFLAAFEHAVERARLIAQEAYARESSWRGGIRAALAELLILMDEEPGLARLCIVEALRAGERVVDRRAGVLEELAEVIDRGRASIGGACEPPGVAAESVVGGIFAVLHTRVLEQSEEQMADLLGPLMSVIVLPYLGARAAGWELRRPPPKRSREERSQAPGHHRDPLEGLNMRITYRTMKVLTVTAEHPGASNREIAEESGIVDQGQVSKLLNRLARLQLVENIGEGPAKRAPNAWQLTPRGAQVERATRTL